MTPGPWQIIIVVLVVVLFFGRGRISDMMGDLAKGITSFKKGLRDDDDESGRSADRSEPPRIVSQPAPPQPVPSQPAPTTSEAPVESRPAEDRNAS